MVQKLHNIPFSKYFPEVSVGTNEGQIGRDIDQDSSKISMLVADVSECKGDTFSSPRSGPKIYLSEPRCS